MFAVALVQDNDLISMAFSLTGIKDTWIFLGFCVFRTILKNLLPSAVSLCREVVGLK